jgi:glucuronoarabinoxylan endo-1,4-beta-xylanase
MKWQPQVEELESRLTPSAATINWISVFQKIDGFGASSAWTLPSMTPAQAQLFFSQKDGIGLSLLRSRIAPDPSGTSGEVATMQQAQAMGVEVWSTPWSPPAQWKSNGNVNNGGYLLPSHYQDYANELASYVLNMKAQGITIHAVSIQNEPDIVASYESCTWTSSQFAAFLPIVANTFDADGVTAKLLLPEESGWHFELASTVMNNPRLWKHVGILAGHDYDGGYDQVQAPGKAVWETEVSDFATFDPTMTSGIQYALEIHNFMTVVHANAWNYWWLVSGNADNEGLVGSNGQTTKRLYTLGNYSKFVRPGWVNIGEADDGGVAISAFKDSATGRFAIVVVNSGSAVTENLTFNGATIGTITPWVTTANLNLARLKAFSGSGSSFTATLAADSVTTFVGTATTATADVATLGGSLFGTVPSALRHFVGQEDPPTSLPTIVHANAILSAGGAPAKRDQPLPESSPLKTRPRSADIDVLSTDWNELGFLP